MAWNRLWNHSRPEEREEKDRINKWDGESLMADIRGTKRDTVVLRPQLSARQGGPTNRKAVTWVQSQHAGACQSLTSIYGAAGGCWLPWWWSWGLPGALGNSWQGPWPHLFISVRLGSLRRVARGFEIIRYILHNTLRDIFSFINVLDR